MPGCPGRRDVPAWGPGWGRRGTPAPTDRVLPCHVSSLVATDASGALRTPSCHYCPRPAARSAVRDDARGCHHYAPMTDRGARTSGDRSESAPGAKSGQVTENRAPGATPKRSGPPSGTRVGAAETAAPKAARRDGRPPPPEPAPTAPSRTGWAVAGGVFLLTVAYLPNLSYSSIAPETAVLMVLRAAGLPLLVARALALVPAQNAAQRWAAWCGIGFVAVGGLSVAWSAAPALSLVGPFQQPTGWAFMVAVAGCWALGTGLGDPERRLVETALIAGAIVNAVVAILQVLVGLGPLDLPSYGGQATGTFGNPVFLGALLAGAVALVGPRFVSDPVRYGVITALLGLGLGMCGERLPALLTLVVIRWMVWRGWRQRDSSGAGAQVWKRVLLFGILAIGSVVAGSLVTALRNAGGVLNQTAASTASETFGQRASVWAVGLRAVAAHPLLGAGPGQFLVATSKLYSESFTRTVGGIYFLTAHNFIIEYAATIGV